MPIVNTHPMGAHICTDYTHIHLVGALVKNPPPHWMFQSQFPHPTPVGVPV